MTRQETFFIQVKADGGETYFPKPASTVRPVRYIQALTEFELAADPYTFSKVAGLLEYAGVLLTLRDRNDRVYMQNVPAAIFCNVALGLRRTKRFRSMPLDPQRCSAVLAPGASPCQLCLVFTY